MTPLRTSNSTRIYSADFASLFTNLPHSVIKLNMFQLLSVCFKNQNYIRVQGNHCSYSVSNNGTGSFFTFQEVCYLLESLLENSVAVYGNKVYRQRCGIPQGASCSPQIADLTLSYMEYKFIKSVLETRGQLQKINFRTFFLCARQIRLHTTDSFSAQTPRVEESGLFIVSERKVNIFEF